MCEIMCLHPSFTLSKRNDVHWINWCHDSKNILIIHKMNTPSVVEGLKAVVYFLLKHFNVYIFLEKPSIEALSADKNFKPILEAHLRQMNPPPSGDRSSKSPEVKFTLPIDCDDIVNDPQQMWRDDTKMCNSESAIIKFDHKMANEPNLTDLIICMGGDGTLLHVASIFQDTVPPVISFFMGTLGFLTPFNFSDFPYILTKFYQEGGPCIMRSRLCCQVIRGEKTDSPTASCARTDDLETQTGSNVYHVMNEATFTRGICPYLAVLVLAVNGKEVTRFRGDGLIISTPTGSTAYSMSSGASILNPAVPAILVTPINAHSLSCRPLVLPFCTRLEVAIATDARCRGVYLSHDGRLRHHHIIRKHDRVVFTASHYPVPCFGSENQVADWFRDLAHCLHWNSHHPQNAFNEGRFLPDRFREYSSANGSSSNLTP